MENLLFTWESEDGGGQPINFEKEEFEQESELKNLHTILVGFEEEKRKEFEETFSSKSSVVMHELLSLLDPPMKAVLHSKEHRKIMNALFRIYKHKQTISQWYLEAPKLRVKKPLVIILQASKGVLEQRIRKRAGLMLQVSFIKIRKGWRKSFKCLRNVLLIHKPLILKKEFSRLLGINNFTNFTRKCARMMETCLTK